MKQRQKLLTEEQWELVEPMLPPPKRRRDNRGRPWASNRGCFEGILWVLQTGAAWRFLPDKFPSPSTCWRRLKQWEDEGVWLQAWRTLLGALDQEGLLKWDEAFLDGSFAPATKTGTGDCRSRLRFRSAARAPAPPRYRTDRALSGEQPTSAVRRQTQAP